MQQNGSLDYYGYIKKHQSNLTLENFEYLEYEIYNRLWFHGPYLKNEPEYKPVKIDFLKLLYSYFKHRIKCFKNKESSKDVVVFQQYFNFFNNESFQVQNPYDIVLSFNEYVRIYRLRQIICNSPLNVILSAGTNELINSVKTILRKYYSNAKYAALFLPYDSGFWERLLINIFKENKKPTFCYIHGIPGIYTSNLYKQTDYILVWGKGTKQIFENYGINNTYIFNNSKYKAKISDYKGFSLEKILVLSSSQCGSQYNDRIRLKNPSNSLLYLEMIKDVLLSLHINKATLRIHPSENKDWYRSNIDLSFYVLDTNTDAFQTIKDSSLVIGPTSTMLFDVIYNGIPYVLFTPTKNNKEDLFEFELVEPFDGSNSKIPISRNQEELYNCLINKVAVDQSVFYDFVNTSEIPDDYEKIIQLIGKNA